MISLLITELRVLHWWRPVNELRASEAPNLKMRAIDCLQPVIAPAIKKHSPETNIGAHIRFANKTIDLVRGCCL